MAIRAAKLAGGQPYRVMVLLVLVTAGASALLDNVTTVLLVVPVTLLVCERLGLHPLPFLMAEALASNIGGAATRRRSAQHHHRQSRRPDVHRLSGPHAAGRAGGAGLRIPDPDSCHVPQSPVETGDRGRRVDGFDEREAIKDPRLLLRSGIVLGVILIGFLLQRQI